jgi:hypothetical protein
MNWKFFLFLIFVLINFTIFKIGDLEFTIGYIIVYLLPILIFKKIIFSKKILLLYLFFLLLDLFRIFLIQSLSFSIAISLNVHLQLFLLLAFIGLYLRSELKDSVVLSLSSTLKFIAFTIFLSIIIQYFSYYFLGNSLYNFFGNFQWMYPLTSEYFRPKSFYLEPSYLALVLNSFLLSDFLINSKEKIFTKYRFSLILFTFVTGSMFGIIVCLFIFLFLFISDLKPKILPIIIIFFIFLFLLSFNFLFKLSEIATINTSGYERVLLPILVIFYMIFNYNLFFGIPFGYDYLILDSMKDILFIMNSTIQNSFFLLIVYSGLIFIPFLFLYIKKIKVATREEKLLLLTIPLLMFNSGGLYSFYYSFFVFLIPILALRVNYANKV